MRSKIANVLVAAIVMAVSNCALGRTETVTVTELDGLYEIIVVTEERSLIPLHPDKGFFPKLRREVRFMTTGPGTGQMIDGQAYRRYVINQDIVTVLDNCLYASGEVLFSEQAKTLVINATLTASHSQYANHSGTYRGAEFLRPAIAILGHGKALSEIGGTHVRATGHFRSADRKFVVAGAAYDAHDVCSPKDGETVDILARVIHPDSEPSAPYLYVLRKGSQSQPPCCPWGR